MDNIRIKLLSEALLHAKFDIVKILAPSKKSYHELIWKLYIFNNNISYIIIKDRLDYYLTHYLS